MSNPILNPPQSSILGMREIQERPVARDGAVLSATTLFSTRPHSEAPPWCPTSARDESLELDGCRDSARALISDHYVNAGRVALQIFDDD